MLSKERSEQLTHTGPGTPGGDLLRRYWQPIALARELPSDGAPLALTIMSEDLVLFRDDKGKVGLLERGCCHRGMDLGYGRVEDGGLRCIYHGWLFDAEGNCLEQPGEPEGSELYKTTCQPSYPCQEIGGLIFAYMGPGEAPILPPLEIFSVAPEHRIEIKLFQECNYLQASEGNLDPAHQSFLHGFEGGQEASTDFQIREPVGGTRLTNLAMYADNKRPGINIEDTQFGIRALISRPIKGEGTFLKIYNFAMPNYAIVPGGAGADGYAINWHVPIDNENHWKFNIIFNRAEAIDIDGLSKSVLPEMESEFHTKRNRKNGYLQDRSEMKGGWFAGLGPCFVDHDSCVTEMQKPIQDRTKENLGEADKMIVRARRQMFDALTDIAAGKDPLGVIRGEATNWVSDMRVASEFFAESENWKEGWRERAERRLSAAE